MLGGGNFEENWFSDSNFWIDVEWRACYWWAIDVIGRDVIGPPFSLAGKVLGLKAWSLDSAVLSSAKSTSNVSWSPETDAKIHKLAVVGFWRFLVWTLGRSFLLQPLNQVFFCQGFICGKFHAWLFSGSLPYLKTGPVNASPRSCSASLRPSEKVWTFSTFCLFQKGESDRVDAFMHLRVVSFLKAEVITALSTKVTKVEPCLESHEASSLRSLQMLSAAF